MFQTTAVIKKLSERLSLPYTGTEQDWAIEMADAKRIDVFLGFYRQTPLADEEKYAVMALMLASYNAFLENFEPDEKWLEIKAALEADNFLFDTLMAYWSLENETDESDLFPLTPLIRSVKRNA